MVPPTSETLIFGAIATADAFSINAAPPEFNAMIGLEANVTTIFAVMFAVVADPSVAFKTKESVACAALKC